MPNASAPEQSFGGVAIPLWISDSKNDNDCFPKSIASSEIDACPPQYEAAQKEKGEALKLQKAEAGKQPLDPLGQVMSCLFRNKHSLLVLCSCNQFSAVLDIRA
jgi:hypothetical protein